jgi:MoxR-like ATPase
MHGRLNCSFEDVQALAQPVLAHRIILDYSARIDGSTPRDVVAALVKEVPAQDLKLPPTLREAAREA